MTKDILSIREMNIFPADKVKKNTYFSVEHFEGMGEAWEAIYGVSEKIFLTLEEKIAKGKVVFNSKGLNNAYSGIIDYQDKEISSLFIIKKTEERNEFLSACPVLKGINHQLKLKEIYSWENGGEGEFAATTKSGKILNFFNPFYAVDSIDFQKNKEQTISLSGLAYSIDKLEEKEFSFNDGPNYETFLKEFLSNNPTKTEKDFVPPIHKLDADNFRMFTSKNTTCIYEIVGQIEDISFTNFDGDAIAILKVNMERKIENEYFYMNIYVSQHVAKDYIPKVGDGISAIIWLTGWFN